MAAKPTRLWSERDASSAPLAQVPDFKALAKRLVPSVVSIHIEQKAQPGRGPNLEYYQPFGGQGLPPSPHGRGIGTGFVIESSGVILTNNHVVEHAEQIRVSFVGPDGTEQTMEAEVLGTAPRFDVALIRTKKDARVPIAYLGDSERLEIGDWVMAIGNPFGLSHSVSVGIVSGKGRREINPSGRQGYYDFIQTDASINPGNSGGPLINVRGEVIGINTAINAAGNGIGFAIPINMVKEILPELQTKGRYTRSWIGVRIQPMSEDLAGSLGLSDATGAFVSEVIPGSPAAKAGLLPEDVVLEFDGKRVVASSDLPLFASMAGVGRQVPLKVWTHSALRKLAVVLEAYPEQTVAELPQTVGERSELGITVADITPALAREFRLEGGRGVLVKDVEPTGAAAKAGLRAGDVIHRLNGKKVERAQDFAATVRATKSGDFMRIQLERGGGRLFVGLKRP
jgi:serine protease Do